MCWLLNKVNARAISNIIRENGIPSAVSNTNKEYELICLGIVIGAISTLLIKSLIKHTSNKIKKNKTDNCITNKERESDK